MSEGPNWDARVQIELIKAPLGSRNKIQILMRGETPGMSQDDTGNVLKATVQSRNLGRIVKNIHTLFRDDQVKISVGRTGEPLRVVTHEMGASIYGDWADPAPAKTIEAPPSQRPSSPPASPRTAAASTPRSAGPTASPMAQVTPGGPSQEDLETDAEGSQGNWPFGVSYRPSDEAKIQGEAKKTRTPREGKKKITVGVDSDRSYVVEPTRDGGARWRSTKCEPDGSRTEIGRAESWRDAVLFIRAHERDLALAGLAAVAPAPAPVPPSTPARAKPTPAPASGASPDPTVVSPAAPSEAGAPGSTPFSMWQLGRGTEARWSISDGASGEEIQDDDLESALRRVFSSGSSPFVVVGWNGVGPTVQVKVPPQPVAPVADVNAIMQAVQDKLDAMTAQMQANVQFRVEVPSPPAPEAPVQEVEAPEVKVVAAPSASTLLDAALAALDEESSGDSGAINGVVQDLDLSEIEDRGETAA